MAERTPIPRSVRGVLGGQASEDLVTWLDSGHEELRAGIRSDMQVLINQLDEKLTNRIDRLDEKLSNRTAALDEKLSLRIHQVDLRVAESKADLMRWSFVFWSAPSPRSRRSRECFAGSSPLSTRRLSRARAT